MHQLAGHRALIAAVLVLVTAPVQAAPACSPTAERPYVCDVGAPRTLTAGEIDRLVEIDGSIRAVVARIGMPDLMQVQKVDVEAPWYNWEVRAYYRELDQMLAFGRAFILDSPRVSMLRYQGPLPRAHAAPQLAVANADGSSADAARTAEAAALRAEAAVVRMETALERSLGKR